MFLYKPSRKAKAEEVLPADPNHVMARLDEALVAEVFQDGARPEGVLPFLSEAADVLLLELVQGARDVVEHLLDVVRELFGCREAVLPLVDAFHEPFKVSIVHQEDFGFGDLQRGHKGLSPPALYKPLVGKIPQIIRKIW